MYTIIPKGIDKSLLTILFLLLISLILGFPTKLLWNYSLSPVISSVNDISFWQGVGINCLSSILFSKVNLELKQHS
jgi:hypothetical protein